MNKASRKQNGRPFLPVLSPGYSGFPGAVYLSLIPVTCGFNCGTVSPVPRPTNPPRQDLIGRPHKQLGYSCFVTLKLGL